MKKMSKKKVLTEAQRKEDFSVYETNINMQKRAGIITEARSKQLISEAWNKMVSEEDEDEEFGRSEEPMDNDLDDGAPDMGDDDMVDVDVDIEDDDGGMEMGMEDEVDLSNPEELAARLADRIADVIEDTLRVSIDVESDGVPLDDVEDDLGSDLGGGDELPAPDGEMGPQEEEEEEEEEELMELKDKGPKGKTPSKMKYSVPDQKPKPASKPKDMTIKEQLAKRVASEIAKTIFEAREQKASKSKSSKKNKKS